LTSRISRDFLRDFSALPVSVRRRARAAYRLFLEAPHHSSLKFKKLPPHDDIWSVRIAGS
jgi:hypothetical protein